MRHKKAGGTAWVWHIMGAIGTNLSPWAVECSSKLKLSPELEVPRRFFSCIFSAFLISILETRH